MQLFPYILDNTRECYYFSVYFWYGSQWDQCSTTLIKGEPYAETALTSTTTTLLLFCVKSKGFGHRISNLVLVFIMTQGTLGFFLNQANGHH